LWGLWVGLFLLLLRLEEVLTLGPLLLLGMLMNLDGKEDDQEKKKTTMIFCP
jgi:hypothetical protein